MSDYWGWVEPDLGVDYPYLSCDDNALFETTGPTSPTAVIKHFNTTTQTVIASRGFGTYAHPFTGPPATDSSITFECWGAGKRRLLARRIPHVAGTPGDGSDCILALDTSDPDFMLWDFIPGTEFDVPSHGWTGGPDRMKYVPPNGDQFTFLATASGVQNVYVVDSSSLAIVDTVTMAGLEGSSGNVQTYAYSADGRWRAFATDGNAVSIFDRASGTRVAHFTSPVSVSDDAFYFSEDGYYLYYVGGDGQTYVYNETNWLLDIIYPAYFDGPISASPQLLSPDNKWWFGGANSFFFDESFGVVWNFDGEVIQTLGGGNSQRHPVGFNADFTQDSELLIIEQGSSDTADSLLSAREPNFVRVFAGGTQFKARWRPFR